MNNNKQSYVAISYKNLRDLTLSHLRFLLRLKYARDTMSEDVKFRFSTFCAVNNLDFNDSGKYLSELSDLGLIRGYRPTKKIIEGTICQVPLSLIHSKKANIIPIIKLLGFINYSDERETYYLHKPSFIYKTGSISKSQVEKVFRDLRKLGILDAEGLRIDLDKLIEEYSGTGNELSNNSSKYSEKKKKYIESRRQKSSNKPKESDNKIDEEIAKGDSKKSPKRILISSEMGVDKNYVPPYVDNPLPEPLSWGKKEYKLPYDDL